MARDPLAALAGYLSRMPLRGQPDEPIFLTGHGHPWSSTAYSHCMQKLIAGAWRHTGIDALRGYQPHWLRASFVSAVRGRSVELSLVQRYIGHKSDTILEEHYNQTSIDRLRDTVVAAIETWFSPKAADPRADAAQRSDPRP